VVVGGGVGIAAGAARAGVALHARSLPLPPAAHLQLSAVLNTRSLPQPPAPGQTSADLSTGRLRAWAVRAPTAAETGSAAAAGAQSSALTQMVMVGRGRLRGAALKVRRNRPVGRATVKPFAFEPP